MHLAQKKQHSYLVFLIPAEVIPAGKLLRPLHHEVDEVATPPEAADDHEVGKDPQEPPQVNVLVLLVLLLVHDGLLLVLVQNQVRCSTCLWTVICSV